jgi:DNA topoisomerase-3
VGKRLIICEKPSVASDVARALGAKKVSDAFYESDTDVVGFAVGHLVEQVDPEAYDDRYKTWRFADLPILPEEFRYEARDARAQKQLTQLHKAINRKDVDEIVNACDAGREGELIFKLIYQTSKSTKPVKRAWFSSMTRNAIKDAFDHLRDDSEMRPLEDAARARSEADWLVGMNASRAATTQIGSRKLPLSLGRVQTPTLAIVVRRDLEIAAFVPEDYWQIRATFATVEGASYTGFWHRGSKDRLPAAEEAETIARAASGADAKVVQAERKPVSESAPMLYDLTSLQRDANSRYGFTANRTLAAAQACYEQYKVITYPRTNSRFLSGDLVPSLRSIARSVGAADATYQSPAAYVAGLDVLPLARVVNDAKVTDHHAIIPTDDTHTLSRLSNDERRIYDLVARRFLAVFHPDAKYEQTTIETEAAEERFRSRGKVLIDAGWRAAYGVEPDREKADDEEGEQDLPPLAEGDAVHCDEAEVLAKQTKPPAHYSDATLLRAMETAGRLVEDDAAAEAMKESGLGTPATRAATIERLIDKEYLERQGRQLRATDRGIGLVSALGDQPLASPALTGAWEQRLSDIEHGRGDRVAFMHDISSFTADTVAWFADKDRSIMRAHRRVIGPCPNGDGEIVERPMSYSCTSWKSKAEPGCGYQIWKRIGGRVITPEEAAEFVRQGISGDQIAEQVRSERPVVGPCPNGDGEIVEREKSFGCTSYRSKDEPGCGFVIWKRQRGKPDITLEMARELLATGELPQAPSKEPIGDCPTPGCGGKIVENSRAFGCTSWKSRKEPGCGFVIWKSQRGRGEVTREMAEQMLREGNFEAPAAAARPAREPLGPCPSEGCGGTIVANRAGWGCDSWKSKRKPGCGFAIWRRQNGREISRDEALWLLERGETELPDPSPVSGQQSSDAA